MEKKKIKHFQSALQEIRMEIVGGVEKSQNNGKKEEAEQMPDISDDAARAYDRKLQGDLEEQEWKKLKQVEAALEKIEVGEYGICNQCEKDIPTARLKIVPYTEFCTQCLSNIETNGTLDDQKTKYTREP